MVQLEIAELINGIFSIIIVIFATIIGIIIISKYPKTKDKNYLLIGIGTIGLVSIWWAGSVSTIHSLLTYRQIPDPLYIFIANGFLPIVSVLLIAAITDLIGFKEKNTRKIILCFYIIIAIVFEIFFLFYLFIDYSVLGVLINPVDASYNPVVSVYQAFLLMSLLVFGILFIRIAHGSDSPELKLKSKIMLVGLSLFITGSILDLISVNLIILLIIGRLIIMMSAFLTYCGFILPDWLRRVLKRTDLLE